MVILDHHHWCASRTSFGKRGAVASWISWRNLWDWRPSSRRLHVLREAARGEASPRNKL